MSEKFQKYGFKISLEQLQYFFDIANINSGDSFKLLKQYGGLQSIAKFLKTDLNRGLSFQSEVENAERKELYGENKPIIKERKSFCRIILQNFKDLVLQILIAATIISLILGIYSQGWKQGWLQGVSIFIAVLIIVVVTSTNNYIKQIQFQKLNAEVIKKNINVRRNNHIVNISVYDVMVGDIAEIQTGQILSADGILIQGNHIVVDQSSITGESKQIKKQSEDVIQKGVTPFLLSGSKIIEGTGTMIILSIGKNSTYGKIRSMILRDDEQQQTPLQQKLQITVMLLGKIGLAFGIMTFLAMVIHFLVDCAYTPSFKGCVLTMSALDQLIADVIIAITILVVAIPEGLPLAVTITLAYSGQRMKEEHNLVRYLAATQIMGGVNNICSDKTGTLTKNIMSVQRILLQENQINITQKLDKNFINPNYLKIFLNSICQNTNAYPIVEADGTFTAVGNKTQCALLELVYKMDYNYKEIRNTKKILKIFEFSSKNKKMSTIFQQIDSQYIFTKGAPQILLKNCTRFVNSKGVVQKISPKFIQQFNDTVTAFTKQSLRTLLLAYKPLNTNNNISNNSQDYQNDLIVLTLVGIKDPIKEGVADTIIYCKNSGITVRMVTGDNKLTAISIAKQAGILQKDFVQTKGNYSVMQGAEFRSFVGGIINVGTDQQAIGDIHNFSLLADQLVVLARSSPQDKYVLTTGLKQLGNVVAVTGDGTNDAPALKKADIGFAMNAGTEVAKQASGIVLEDNNFSSIKTAIKVGRNVFKNVRKFIQFQLTTNFVALLICFFGSIVLKQSPLTTVQMLWINLIIDTLASLALATEPPIESEIEPKPYSRSEHIITSQMLVNIIFQAIFQIIILAIIMFLGPKIFNVPPSLFLTKKQWTVANGKHSTIFFNVFIYLQIWNYINARKIKLREYNIFKNIFNNWMFWVVFLTSITVQVLITQFGGKALKCSPLNVVQHLICFAIGFLCIPYALLYKLILPNDVFLSWEGIRCGACQCFWKKKPQQLGQTS